MEMRLVWFHQTCTTNSCHPVRDRYKMAIGKRERENTSLGDIKDSTAPAQC